MSLIEMGRRLESERQRLKMTAVQVYTNPQICIAQTTYKNYETGKRDMPASLLMKLWDIGFDVMYVLTGVYSDTASLEISETDNDLIYETKQIKKHKVASPKNDARYVIDRLPDEVIRQSPINDTMRLVTLTNELDTNNPADALLVAMYHAEEAMIQAGAVAKVDYDYQDLANVAVKLMQILG